MCGILGMLGFGDLAPEAEEKAVYARLQRLHHRGPDQEGLVHYDHHAVLAHKRLSLLDLSEAGIQPMHDPSGRYAFVYNGEVYNFRYLAARLSREYGVRFRSGSDTEVLLHDLIHSTDLRRTLSAWEGMFAFALYDRHDNTLLLACDRFGIKPLFTLRRANDFWFASEMKAISDLAGSKVDKSALTEYLRTRVLESLRFTMIEGIERLEPGTWLKVHGDGRSERGTFFSLREFVEPGLFYHYDRMPFSKVVEEFGSLLTESVQKHMIADAPLTSFNSGGVDSSLISALATQINPNITLYHANVLGRESELEAATLITKHLHGRLRTADLDDERWFANLVKTVYYNEAPIVYHPNSVPYMLLCQEVQKDGIKAALTGEGADELFLGYPNLVLYPYLEGARRAVQKANRLVARIPKFGSMIAAMPSSAILADRLHSKCWFSEEDQEVEALYGFLDNERERTYHIRGMRYMRFHLYTLLLRNDRMGMAHSIESRFPFLYCKLVRFGMNLPVKHRIRLDFRSPNRVHPFLMDKAPLRYYARRHVPQSIAFRRKIGFPVSVQERLRFDTGFLNDGFLAGEFKLRRPQFTHLLDGLEEPDRLMVFFLEVWGRLYIWRQSIPEVEAHVKAHCSVA